MSQKLTSFQIAKFSELSSTQATVTSQTIWLIWGNWNLPTISWCWGQTRCNWWRTKWELSNFVSIAVRNVHSCYHKKHNGTRCFVLIQWCQQYCTARRLRFVLPFLKMKLHFLQGSVKTRIETATSCWMRLRYKLRSCTLTLFTLRNIS